MIAKSLTFSSSASWPLKAFLVAYCRFWAFHILAGTEGWDCKGRIRSYSIAFADSARLHDLSAVSRLVTPLVICSESQRVNDQILMYFGDVLVCTRALYCQYWYSAEEGRWWVWCTHQRLERKRRRMVHFCSSFTSVRSNRRALVIVHNLCRFLLI